MVTKYIHKGYSVLKEQGIIAFLIICLQKVEKIQRKRSGKQTHKLKHVSLVYRSDAMQADWSGRPYHEPKTKVTPPFTVNWVMSPPSSGGGHQNIFRFIEYLEQKGHKNNVYLYSSVDDMPITQARVNAQRYCRAQNVNFARYRGDMALADAVFATGWETAYPVFNDKSAARKMYFVQDFEPYFFPVGTDYVLAENTYRFGFHGITAGRWLADKLSKEYGMSCSYYDFGADTDLYQLTNEGRRKEVFFYARPVTERRGFDLGIMALEIFHKHLPDYTINLAGWDISEYDVPFPYVNHKSLPLKELPLVYNRCAAALVISLTNMSLLPLELLACGTIPVINDGPNNRLVSDNKYIAYTQASPAALASKLAEVVQRADLRNYAKQASASIDHRGWNPSLQKFEAILIEELTRG